MINRLFEAIIIFFSIMMLFGVYLGYSDLIMFETAIISLIVSFAITGFIIRCRKNKTRGQDVLTKLKDKKTILAILIFVLFIGMYLLILAPNFVFPLTCSDVANHSLYTRLIGKNGSFFEADGSMVFSGIPLVYSHVYPFGFYGVSSSLYLVVGNSYLVNSMLGFLLILFTGIGVYALSKHFFGKNAALFSSFVWLFAITSLTILESGFLTQIFATLFFTGAVYAYVKRDKLLLFLAAIGLVTYPPIFVAFFIFVIVELLISAKLSFKRLVNDLKEKKYLIGIIILACIAMFPEFLGMAIKYLNSEHYLTTALLIRGGVYTPNFFGLVAFIPAVVGLFLLIKKRSKEQLECFSFLLAPLLMSGAVVGYYALNLLISFSTRTEIHSLYQAVKFFYLALIPASMFAGLGFAHLMKKYSKKKIIVGVLICVLTFHFIYFAGYLSLYSEKQIEPDGFYSAVEFANNIDGEFVLGIDDCFFKNESVVFVPAYASLFDNPFTPQEFNCQKIDFIRGFTFTWAQRDDSKNELGIVDSTGKPVLIKGSVGADYLMTDCSVLDKSIVFEEGNVRIYDLR
ncbi:MAG: hypothetical protein HOE11_02145 [Candidatus Diapherotrites archaeon]|jgi:hypothetical protein|nr:hypothetical protein [Candidatus Diapherotrites archaeon]MBT4596642.1 hypothetical protein [Candidatus Diapherotrites archaeon]